MHRFYCPSLTAAVSDAPPANQVIDLSDTIVTLDRDESQHARRVLRLERGDAVVLFDGCGVSGAGAVEAVEGEVRVRIDRVERHAPPRPTIDIAAALPKGSRVETMVNQLSQLGADRLIPLRTRHSVVDPRDTKLDRLRRHAIESAKQCGRLYLMRIADVTDFGEELLSGEHDLRLIADTTSACGSSPPCDESTLHDLQQRLVEAKRVLIFIGPEGGWSEEERNAAQHAGCFAWSLGPHVMRIETAAAAAVAIARNLTQFER